jgi:ERCC4-type nuclease
VSDEVDPFRDLGAVTPNATPPAPVPNPPIIVDTREPKAIIEILQSKAAALKPVPEIIAVQLQEEDYVVGHVHITRKRTDDLLKSIYSGHLSDELARLLPVAAEVALVIENAPETDSEGLQRVAALRRSLNAVMTVERTENLEETADYLLWVRHKVIEGTYGVTKRRPVLIDHVNPVATAYLWMPGIGPDIAEALAEKYPKPDQLWQAMRDTYAFDKTRWKTKKAWRAARWTAGIRGLGDDTAEQAEAANIDGAF